MEISKPTLIIDRQKCLENISFMAEKAKKHQLLFRPHFKTHQLITIGELYRKQGVTEITASSVSMANQFAEYGWKDITIAFPVNINEIKEINYLTEKISLNLIADNIFSLDFLSRNLLSNTGIFIEIDTGHHRSGVRWDDFRLMDELVNFLSASSKLQFKGFLTHSGHSYTAASKEEIISIHQETIRKTRIIKERYIKDLPSLIISTGDTPCCSLCDDFTGVDEIRPGNFVFYDVMQYYLGSCKTADIAVNVACPVVSLNLERNELVVYCGAIHLSKESVADDKGRRIFGLVTEIDEKGWSIPVEDTYVSALSQEHGKIKTSSELLKKIKIGDTIGILPVHSCLAVHQLKDQTPLFIH
jgi:D-serine deaminase-like pyridoxal phosphate-dependent protein